MDPYKSTFQQLDNGNHRIILSCTYIDIVNNLWCSDTNISYFLSLFQLNQILLIISIGQDILQD
jgi:hypothetical protein